MNKFKLGLGVTTGMDVQTTRWIISNADQLGANSIWIGEDIGKGQDIFVLSAETLMRTKYTRVGTGIVPILTHEVLALSRAVATLYTIAPNRFVFGTGIGGIQDLERKKIKVERPVTLLRKGVLTMKQLWGGKEVSMRIPPLIVENEKLHFNTTTNIPIFLGVRGPQMLKLAGEIANGVILSGPINYIKWAIEQVQNASINSGRQKNDVEIVVWNPTVPLTGDENKKLARKIVAIILADTPRPIINLLEVDQKHIEKIIQLTRMNGPDKGAELVDQELIDLFCIAGGPKEMAKQFETLADMGVSEIVIGPPYYGTWKTALKEIFDIARNTIA